MKKKINIIKYCAIILGIMALGCTNEEESITIPAEVTNYTAIAGEEQVTLSWTKPTDDIKEYWITTDPLLIDAFSIDKNLETFTMENLKGDIEYTFTLLVKHESGGVSDGVLVTATPSAVDRTPPSEAGNFSAVPDDGKISLSWAKPSENDLAGYELTYEPGAVSITLEQDIESYVLEGLTNDIEYTFTLKSKDTSGNISAGTTAKAIPKLGDNIPPAEATDFTFSGDYSAQQFTMNWANPTDADFKELELTYYFDPANPTTVTIPSSENSINIDASYEQNYVLIIKTKDELGNFSTGVTNKVRFGNYSAGNQADMDSGFDSEISAILAGKLKLSGADITDLSVFSNLTRVGGKFDILTTGITNLDAFSNLTYIDRYINITNNVNLTDFCGLKNLINVGGAPSDYTVTGNASNPTQQEIVDNCN